MIKTRFTARNFCTSFESSADCLEVTVQGFGTISTPLQPKMIRELIKIAQPSQFGFKDKTLYDQNIRKSYEIEKSCISLGREFEEQIESSLERIKKDLLIPSDGDLRAELHNLLIYEKSCFFDFHQDSEKEDGMIATLSIILPTTYRGGELVIDYQGHTESLGSCNYSKYGREPSLQYVAFYADCQHKINKLSYGYRLALTFNLILEHGKEQKSERVSGGLAKSLDSYFSAQHAVPSNYRKTPKWFVFLLNHQYTPRSLAWENLKGADRTVAKEFKQAAKELDLEIFLTLAESHETWSAYESRSPRYYDYVDDLEEDSEEGVEIDDLVNSETSLSGWIDQCGKKLDYGEKYIRDEFIFSTLDNSSLVPEKSEYEGFMGNYGNTIDRWYNRSAIVLWEKNHSIIAKMSIDLNCGLSEYCRLLKHDFEKSSHLFPSVLAYLGSDYGLQDVEEPILLDFLLAIKKYEFFAALCKHLSLRQILNLGVEGIEELIIQYGDSKIATSLSNLKIDDRSRLIPSVLSTMIKSMWIKAPEFSDFVLNKWIGEFESNISNSGYRFYSKESRLQFTKEIQLNLKSLAEVLTFIERKQFAVGLLDQMVKEIHVFQSIYLFELLSSSDLCDFFEDFEQYRQIKSLAEAEIKTFLKDDLGPSNWKIDDMLPCDCELCTELNKFLRSPITQKKVWPLNKYNRGHIHQTIDSLDLPLTHETERVGRPYRLILRKTPAMFSLRKEKEKKYQDLLKRMS
ncbi:hypothetical protein [Pseudobacteriovorax antillogorgiicola]|nr:hypothetical protein [Pseudobacteriovorax antillogorgiicola]